MAEVAEQRKVSYVRMDEGTVEDYALAMTLARPFMAATPERLLAFMETLHHTFPGGRIDRYAHCLQTATRAEDAGECEEIIVAGLLHDIGDSLAPHNHAVLGAEVLRPFVSRHTYWMLRHHDVFQGYYFWDKIGLDKDARDRHRGHRRVRSAQLRGREGDQRHAAAPRGRAAARARGLRRARALGGVCRAADGPKAYPMPTVDTGLRRVQAAAAGADNISGGERRAKELPRPTGACGSPPASLPARGRPSPRWSAGWPRSTC